MSNEIPKSSGPSPIREPHVLGVIQRLNASRRHPERAAFNGPSRHDAQAFANYGFSIHPDQGDLIYLLCRAMGARDIPAMTAVSVNRTGPYIQIRKRSIRSLAGLQAAMSSRRRFARQAFITTIRRLFRNPNCDPRPVWCCRTRSKFLPLLA